MTTVEVAEIYERHIKTMPPEGRQQLLALIARELSAEGASSAAGPGHSILELHGLGKEIWDGIDAQDYVNRLRDERRERAS